MKASNNWNNIKCERFDVKTNSYLRIDTSHVVVIRTKEDNKVIEMSEYCESCKMSYWHAIDKELN
jgi:hypothetical protein